MPNRARPQSANPDDDAIADRHTAALREQAKLTAPLIRSRLAGRWRETYRDLLDRHEEAERTSSAAQLIAAELGSLPRLQTALKAYERARSTGDPLYSEAGGNRDLASWIEAGIPLLKNRAAFLRRWRRQSNLAGATSKSGANDRTRNVRILVSRWGEGLSIPAIAEREHMTMAAVRQVLRREKAAMLASGLWTASRSATRS